MHRISVKASVLFLFCFTLLTQAASAEQAGERDGTALQRDAYPEALFAAQEPHPMVLSWTREEENRLFGSGRTVREVIPIVNRPANIYGLTGLMVTTSAYSLAAGKFEAGVSVLSEKSTKLGYNVLQVPVTATYGLTDQLEVGLRTKYASVESTSPRTTRSGVGSAELALKYRFGTDSDMPELAVGLVGILPAGSDTKGLNEARHRGMKVVAMATSETKLGESSFLGLYFEGQVVFIDRGSKTPNSDRYYVYNAGLLLPLSSDNRLQGMLEFNGITKKSGGTTADPLEVNEGGVTPALRFVTKKLNVTAGAQIMDKKVAEYKDTVRWICTVGYTF